MPNRQSSAKEGISQIFYVRNIRIFISITQANCLKKTLQLHLKSGKEGYDLVCKFLALSLIGMRIRTPPAPKKKVLDKFADIVYVENPK